MQRSPSQRTVYDVADGVYISCRVCLLARIRWQQLLGMPCCKSKQPDPSFACVAVAPESLPIGLPLTHISLTLLKLVPLLAPESHHQFPVLLSSLDTNLCDCLRQLQGTYSEGGPSAVCQSCPAGGAGYTTDPDTAATSIASCVCLAGYGISDNGMCRLCPR